MRKCFTKISLIASFLLSILIAPTALALDAATLNMFAQNNITKYDPDCTPSYAATTLANRPTGSQITWIGDSYTVGALDLITTRFSGANLADGTYDYYKTSKQFYGKGSIDDNNPAGNIILKYLADNDNLREYVVFALGTNSGTGTSADTAAGWIEEVMNTLGDDRSIVFVTPYTKRDGAYDGITSAMKSAKDSHNNIYIADWEAKATGNEDEYFSNDGVHPSAEGYEAWIQTIYDALPGSNNNVITGGTVEEKVWAALATFIPTAEQIAGIMGNLALESGYHPLKWQGSGNFGYTATSIFSEKSQGIGGQAFGIAQWDKGRRGNVIGYIKDQNEELFDFVINHQEIHKDDTVEDFISTYGEDLFDAFLSLEMAFMESELEGSESATGVLFFDSTISKTPGEWATEWEKLYERPRNHHPDRAKEAERIYAQYAGAGITAFRASVLSGTASQSDLCAGSTTASGPAASDIAELAVEAAWPWQEGESGEAGTCDNGEEWKGYKKSCTTPPKPKYEELYKTAGITIGYQDCGAFVASVILGGGFDPGFPPGNTSQILKHLSETTDLWEEIENKGDSSNLQPGDVLVVHQGSGGRHHTEIYVGSYGGEYGDFASASQDTTVGALKNGEGSLDIFHVFRYKGNAGSLKSGGMTLEEAKKFMEPYVEEAKRVYNNGKYINESYDFSGGHVDACGTCNALKGTLNNCSAFSQWFINRYTTIGQKMPLKNGHEMAAKALEFEGTEDSGSTPTVYSVFSTVNNGNHTGIVLGIDQARGKIIIGEASYSDGFKEGEWPGAHEKDLSTYSSGKYRFTDLSGVLKGLN